MVPTNHLKRYLLKEIGDFPACHVGFSGGVKDTNYFLGNDPFFFWYFGHKGVESIHRGRQGVDFLEICLFGACLRVHHKNQPLHRKINPKNWQVIRASPIFLGLFQVIVVNPVLGYPRLCHGIFITIIWAVLIGMSSHEQWMTSLFLNMHLHVLPIDHWWTLWFSLPCGKNNQSDESRQIHSNCSRNINEQLTWGGSWDSWAFIIMLWYVQSIERKQTTPKDYAKSLFQ